ncbi:MAG: hypothetical protein GC201_04395 [Alphaproteobacteria bacterium]|nr:hypothetical protein [Alphaproteobacteria bacterium]
MPSIFQRLLIAGVFAAISFPGAALAWGEKGHEVVAGIAARHLTDAARSQIRDLLGGSVEDTMMQAANWSHEIEASRPDTRAWHFVDIPVSAEGYSAQRDCPKGDCAIARMTEEMKTVADKARPKAERTEALKYLIGLMGDIHQPLRCGTDGNDHGRDVKVLLGKEKTDLFQIWDDRVVDALGGTAGQLVSRLTQDITPEERRIWPHGNVTKWCEESAKKAESAAYADLDGAATEGDRILLNPDYPYAKQKITAEQLKKGGLRLAALLNFVLK